MADKTRIIDIYEKDGTFQSIFKRFSSIHEKEEYNTHDLSLVRRVLSNEKARLLHTIKVKQPKSIYSLAKILDKDFKTVRENVILLKKFGFLDLIEEKSGKRRLHKPVLTANSINITIRI